MSAALIIAVVGTLRCAVLQNAGVFTDLYAERIDAPDMTGAIVRAKVTRAMPGQQAAIVSWPGGEGYWADAGNAQPGAWTTLQIKNGARQGKQPQLTKDVALAGRFLVHLPFGKSIAQSKRGATIALPDNLPGGWIVRRHAAGADAMLIAHELAYLQNLAATVRDLRDGDVLPPQSGWQRALIDHGGMLSGAPSGIICEDRALEPDLRKWLTAAAPDLLPLLHAGDSGADLDSLLAAIATPRVALPQGAALTIESTAAFWAVDVDAGGAQNHFQINLLAAQELARQLRLRNIGGTIVVDFISLRHPAEKQKLLDSLRTAVADDPAGVQIFGISRLGLVEMTRKRRGASLTEIVATRDH